MLLFGVSSTSQARNWCWVWHWQVDRFTSNEVKVRPDWQEAATVVPQDMTFCNATLHYVTAVCALSSCSCL
jgi:hypothetical protein